MRPTTDSPSTPARLRLRSGQTYRLWTGRDAMIMVISGRVRLQSVARWNPSWLPIWQTTLQAEEHCQLIECGWLHIAAEQDCDMLYYAPPRAGMVSLALLGRLATGPLRRAWRVWQMRQS